MRMTAWSLFYESWEPERQSLREALCTLGNGYFASRGAFEEVDPNDIHYPGQYLAGGYNRAESKVADRIIENEDLVNWPNPFCLRFKVEDSEWMDWDSTEVLDFCQELNVQEGVLLRQCRFKDNEGRITSLRSRKFVSMADKHRSAIEWTITAENWSGKLTVESRIQGHVRNMGVKRYQALNSHHVDVIESGLGTERSVYLVCQSRQAKTRVSMACRTEVFEDHHHAAVRRVTLDDEENPTQLLEIQVKQNRSVRFEKIISTYTSRDFAISEPALEARNDVDDAPRFAELLEDHKASWAHVWDHCDIQIDSGEHQMQFTLRLHIFHLIQTVSMKSIGLDVGVPARGLHGEAYRGHIFWDELFIFPILNFRSPEVTRALLMYRYRRLKEAKRYAKREGYDGAMYPWQSGSNGREESQELHLNPKSGNWLPDKTHRQRHINAAVVYNVWKYYQTTGDIEFLTFYGSIMILEIARFWASLAHYNSEKQRYEIHNVVGPDEFHTQYPGENEKALNNNAYTNVMASWCLDRALRVFNILGEDRQKELCEELEIKEEELHSWEEISQKLYVPFINESVISQFEGYDQLEEFPWEEYEKKYGDIQRLDRILEAENDDPNRYQAGKQADVLMLFYLFSAEELQDNFERLGYNFEPDMIPENIKYYMQRVSHGSTLSRVVHSWVLARSDREQSWRLFEEALKSDLFDIQGGTTSEGIHLGAMAGSVDLIQRCFTGLEVREDILWLDPVLPEALQDLRMNLRYRGHWIEIYLTRTELTVTFERSWSEPVNVGVYGQIYSMKQGDQHVFELPTS